MSFPILSSRPPTLVVKPHVGHGPHTVILRAVFGLLLFCPLAFGAVEPWSIFLLESAAALLFAFWIWTQFSSAQISISWNPIFAPMLVFAALVLVQIVAGKTAYRNATIFTFLLYAAYGILCFLVVQCLKTTRQIKFLGVVLSVYGTAVASFALLQGLGLNDKLYWLRTPRGGGWIYGPYVNHNHYAGLMEMLFPLPVVLSFTQYAGARWQKFGIASSAIIAATIFLSGSRGGVAAFLCEILVLSALQIKHRGGLRSQGKSAIVVVTLSACLLIWIGGGKLRERFTTVRSAQRELTSGLRLQIDRDLIKMYPHHPLLGCGLGTFADVYPQYRSFYANVFIDEAHNDYLQLLVEAGAAGFITMIWLLWVVFWNASRKLDNWRTDPNGSAAAAAMLGITGILVHSLVDFNLQVPANAAIFYVLCTIAAMEPVVEHSSRRRIA